MLALSRLNPSALLPWNWRQNQPAAPRPEHIRATGQLKLVLRGPDGRIKEEHLHQNLVVTAGKNWIAARMKTSGIPTEMTHMAIGSGTGTPAAGDTTLGTELGRVALTTSGGTVSGAVVTYNATFAAGTGTGAVAEAGLFNANSSGTLLCRTKFDTVNKGANDSLAIEWAVTIS